jgi:membrane-bound inhibitor of C-type lysozyme
MRTSTLVLLLVALLALLWGWVTFVMQPLARPSGGENIVSYYCDEGVLKATYGTSTLALQLPDGGSMTLPHALSADGARYESGGTVFWSKGDQAFITVGNTTTFSNCVAGTVVVSDSTSSYTDASRTFSFSYPSSLTLSGGDMGYTPSWMYNATTSGMLLAKVTLPGSTQPNTDLADSRFTVGVSSDPSAVATCLMANSGEQPGSPASVDLNGTTYAVFTSNDAAVGNRYDTTSYRALRGDQCYAIGYTIHSLAIENFPSERHIAPFDRAKVQTVLESIVRSVHFLAQ